MEANAYFNQHCFGIWEVMFILINNVLDGEHTI